MPDANANSNEDVKRYFRRNYLAHAIEGGLYMGGLAFVARDTILPPLVKSLGGPLWLIALIPILDRIGVYLPSIFLVHYLERLRWKFPILLLSGFLQRLPMLAAGLVLIFLVDKLPLLTLYIVALSPFVSGLFCGSTYPAWVELVAKTIPPKRRSSLFAVRLIIASCIGLLAGEAIRWTLSEYSGYFGFALLFIFAFASLSLSYGVFATIKETNLPPKHSDGNESLVKSLKEIPEILKNDRRFSQYLVSLMFLNGIYIALPFLSIRALTVLDKPKSFLGALVMAAVVGKFFANFINAYMGDRFGGKIGLCVCMFIYALLYPLSIIAGSVGMFYLVFFLSGYAYDSIFVNRATINMDIAPPDRRVKYQSIITVCLLPSLVCMPLIGGFLMRFTESYTLAAICSSVSAAIGLILLSRIKEPRVS
jgi:MFS family permease